MAVSGGSMHATETFYGSYAGDKVCCISAGFEVALSVTGMFMDFSVAVMQVSVSVAIMQFEVCSTYAGDSFCSK